jgi:hypothetical protein
MKTFLSLLLVLPTSTLAFVNPSPSLSRTNNNDMALFAGGDDQKQGFFAGVKNFFEELDAFVDDASARRLGAGASFYGKRKSNFYGSSDKMKKADKDTFDASGKLLTGLTRSSFENIHDHSNLRHSLSAEDYRVQAGGNYKWIEDENGVLRPVTRLKKKFLD